MRADPRINPVAVELPRLPPAFVGATIAVVADLHAGPLRQGRAAVARLAEAVNSADPDLVVLLGDMVHHGRHAQAYLGGLAALRAPLGRFACLGNHEHGIVWYTRHLGPRWRTPLAAWRERYRQLGIELLVNEARAVHCGQARLWLVGVDDAYTSRADLAAALQHTEEGDCNIAITHSPDLLGDPLAGRLDLVLAGHTHGGQICLPWLGPVWAPCRRPRQRAAGLVRQRFPAAYVTRGVGEGVPIRLGCPREIPLIELRRA